MLWRTGRTAVAAATGVVAGSILLWRCCKKPETPEKKAEKRQQPLPRVISEETRALLAKLLDCSLRDLMLAACDKPYMYVTQTDTEVRENYSQKGVEELGKRPPNQGFAAVSRKGLKPEMKNADEIACLRAPDNWSLYLISSGKGQDGSEVSSFVRDMLPKVILQHPGFQQLGENIEAVMKESFEQVQLLLEAADDSKMLKCDMSGTTVVVAFHDIVHGKFTTAHVGMNEALLGGTDSRLGKASFEGKPLTRSHRPNLKDERQRIEQNGGRVVFDGYANHRVYAKNSRYPGLFMSRTLGFLLGHRDAGLIAEPEVSTFEITEGDKVLLLVSHGVTEFMEPTTAADFFRKDSLDFGVQIERLVKSAWDRWIQEEGGQIVEDLSAIAVSLL